MLASDKNRALLKGARVQQGLAACHSEEVQGRRKSRRSQQQLTKRKKQDEHTPLLGGSEGSQIQ